MRIEHRIDMAAAPEVVWSLTTDVESWPTMMSTVTSVERLDTGPMAVGSRARLVQPGQRPTVWTVTEVEPERLFAWEATVFGMHMVASHIIDPSPSGCRNTLVLDLSGGPTPILGRLLASRLRHVLATENAAFKHHAETP